MKHLNIAIAIIWSDGHILATCRRHDADHLPGVWEFPGGKCEDGETPEECVRREVREEVGIDVAITGTRAIITHSYPERQVALHLFDCRIVSGEPQPLGSAELKWLAPAELRAEEFPPANSGLIEDLKTE